MSYRHVLGRSRSSNLFGLLVGYHTVGRGLTLSVCDCDLQGTSLHFSPHIFCTCSCKYARDVLLAMFHPESDTQRISGTVRGPYQHVHTFRGSAEGCCVHWPQQPHIVTCWLTPC